MTATPVTADHDRSVDVLLQALPYIQRFQGAVVVVKFGGNAMGSDELLAQFAADIVLMHSVGMRPVVIHGGGPQIGAWLKRLGKKTEFVDGHRVTDADTLEIAQMVLVGKVNSDIVSALNVHGPVAVGLSGQDAGLIRAGARAPELGFVGDVIGVDPTIVERLLAMGLVPIISTIGSDIAGQAYNINADAVAGAVAEALGAQKLIFLTDVPGLLADPDDPSSLIQRVAAPEARALIDDGTISGGMIPKITGCLRAIEHGVAQVHLVDGRVPHALLLELFTDAGVGTMVTEGPTEGDAVTATAASPLMPTYAPPTVTFIRGEGSYLWDDDDKRYLDFLSGIAVTSLGHAHPEVAQAISAQAAKLLHVSNLFGNEHNAPLAAAIDELVGGGGQVFFANSGAEANECALKLARKWGGRGKHVVVSAYGSFHGRTLATLHATGQPQKHEAFQPLPEGFRHVAWGDLDALVAAIDPSVAAVFLEPVQGEGGVNPATTEYFAGVRALCDERDLLFIVDEVQTGLGRTGEWFGHQHFGVRPDVITLAKALGNGMPIGACWADAGVAAAFEPGDHATTFGGQPLASAAARKVLEIMVREDVPARATGAGAELSARLEELPAVAGVRGLGLLLGVELAGGLDARTVASDLLAKGLVVNAVTPTALRLTPSLLVSDPEIDEAVELIAEVTE